MAEYEVKIINGEILREGINHLFYFTGYNEDQFVDLGQLHSYLSVCEHINLIKKGGLHITSKPNDITSSFKFIPGAKISEIIRNKEW